MSMAAALSRGPRGGIGTTECCQRVSRGGRGGVGRRGEGSGGAVIKGGTEFR